MTSPSAYPTLTRGDSSTVLLATKAQLDRLGIKVGDVASPEFDRTFELAILAFQQSRGITTDGILGPETFEQIELARYRFGDRVLRFDPVRPLVGDDVGTLQKRLSKLGVYTDRIDSVFAEGTDAAVREIQSGLGLRTDGVVGPNTISGLDSINRNHSTGNLYALREHARVTSSGPSLAGRVIVIEAATSARDFKATPYTSEQRRLEEEYSIDIARRLDGRLSALGAATVLVSSPEAHQTLADELEASAVVTITQDSSLSDSPNGVATFYFGRADDNEVYSPVGKRLAELVQKEVNARTDFLDCRTHARTWQSLAAVRSPKVHVVAGYVSHERDREMLADDLTRDRIADGIAAALQRLYLARDSDPETGALNIQSITN
ncbi:MULTISPECIES: N-acetylmuramoyl-L-alanine amidase [Brevibacterium]|uniref:N-acetylmuramoyl-L-alanine amidase n=1 Tax=Brevibacterium TaxID=1696 RepID=UPI00223ACFC3|nr:MULTISPECIES: peptidoglycan-binding protein [Brevibacterium]MCT1874181.1 peptidoglycan-binding protein [Brevibacterium luteolum]MCT1891422.1 peptidoglycan-binding protein [Brevibacterium luteolum]MCT1893894.1 peptidoglycan-binding protein [Brevibacterium luteolum]MCT1924786.1 peptidoglycan-binding protein [Brevibacterium luteolum]